MSARWEENRQIGQRIRISGQLLLLTPTRFGGGGFDEQLTSMSLLRDPATNRPLLPGASITGAMRAYLREWELGYEQAAPKSGESVVQRLFGDVLESQRESRESYLIVEDAVADSLKTEFRPGVKIDPVTRLAAVEEKGGQLYDMELLEAGTKFPLKIEIALPENEFKMQLLAGLAIALTGFERGEIGMGARKRRGFGECEVSEWVVESYDLKNPTELTKWILGEQGTKKTCHSIWDFVDPEIIFPDKRKRFSLNARFRLDTSLLIRSGGSGDDSADMAHLKSKRNGNPTPILSGTSLAGAIRARSLKIANTIAPSQASTLVEAIFGPSKIEAINKRNAGDASWASRAVIREREIKNCYERVQSRIRIDRFTGGTFPGALFAQQPVLGGAQSEVCVSIELRAPADEHIGLLLFILKDLWSGDLPLGGEASVGRGRLQGIEAELQLYDGQKRNPRCWKITKQHDGKLQIDGEREKLSEFAKAVRGNDEP